MTPKNKNILLVVGCLIALFLCYQLAISKTIQQKQQLNTLKKEALLYQNAPKQLSLLKQKQVYYDSLLTKYQLDGSSIQNNLLKTITTFADANKLKVIAFLEPHIMVNDGLTVKTYEFTVEGDYNAIIQLIYTLEQQTKFGEIVNLHFTKKKNFRTGRYYLQARALLKSFG